MAYDLDDDGLKRRSRTRGLYLRRAFLVVSRALEMATPPDGGVSASALYRRRQMQDDE